MKKNRSPARKKQFSEVSETATLTNKIWYLPFTGFLISRTQLKTFSFPPEQPYFVFSLVVSASDFF